MLFGGVSRAEVTRLSAMLAEIAGRGEGPEGQGCECRKPAQSCIWSGGEGEGEDVLRVRQRA